MPLWIALLTSDLNLVHTIYYRHPDVIEHIASHLARSSQELLAMRKEFEAASAPATC